MKRALKWLGTLVVLNWVAWFAVNFAIGGDAVSGMKENGRYFVSSHGSLTEVTGTLFTFSFWHTYVTWISVGIAALVGVFWKRKRTETP